MRIIDEKGRIFGLINIIDLGVLLLVLAIAFGLYSKVKNMAQPQVYNVEIQVLCKAVHPEIAAQVQAGDKLMAGNAYVDLQLTHVDTTPARVTYSVPQGGPELVSGTDPELKDVLLTIRGTSRSLTPDLTFHGQELKSGKQYWVKSQTYVLEGILTKVEILGSA